ncbi:MAG: uridine phosphorylase [Nitratireductor sp.]
MKSAWYLGYSQADVGDSALLAGDPDRVDRIALLLDDARPMPVKRGLKSVTGTYAGKKVTAVAFGMGAPIATVVLHELADLGVKSFMRIGTAMYFAPVAPGDFVLSDRIACFEGTSRSYVDDVEAQRADAGLNRAVATAVAAGDAQLHTGTFATFDAFYRDMFALDAPTQARVDANRAMLAERGVVAADMETSALVNAAAALDVRFTSLCVGTVDGVTRAKLEPEAMAAAEHRLFTTALSAITSL